VEAYDRRNTERTWQVLDALRTVADRRGVSMGVIALAWLVDRPAVTSVILGARTLQQLDDNLSAAGVHLTADEVRVLDEASASLVSDYPYGEPGVAQRDRHVP
jgi:aryl-alcohol dehydrogenase-like predicted oxidoreductase